MIGAGDGRLRGARDGLGLMPLAVCATPIGNLEDVTLRVLRELAEADVVLCEDTRRTRVLLQRHGISARVVSYHEHNEAERTAELLPRLEGGERVALVSDAGLPGINDPGARLIAAALEAGVPVTVLPGAVGGRDGARRERLFGGALPVRRVPAARRGRASRALGGAGRLAVAGGRVRVAAAAAGDSSLARRRLPGAASRRLPGADEAVRGGRTRQRLRGGGRVRGGAQGRDHARARRVGRGPGRTRTQESPPSPSSSAPACPAARPPISSLG